METTAPKIDTEKRVIVTRPMIGLCHMQVCAVADATDEEILAVCDAENPAGTTFGWATVHRAPEEWLGGEIPGPVECADVPGRVHLLVSC